MTSSPKTKEYNAKLQYYRNQFLIGRAFRHHKGGIYKIKNFVINSDDKEVYAQYIRIDGPVYDPYLEDMIEFVRPASDFLDKEKFVQVIRRKVWVSEDE